MSQNRTLQNQATQYLEGLTGTDGIFLREVLVLRTGETSANRKVLDCRAANVDSRVREPCVMKGLYRCIHEN